jgi:hypothetical protein
MLTKSFIIGSENNLPFLGMRDNICFEVIAYKPCSHHENFLKIKGLLEEFTEVIRPKTLTERLNDKKKLVYECESGREWRKEKRQDIAI